MFNKLLSYHKNNLFIGSGLSIMTRYMFGDIITQKYIENKKK